MKYGVCHLGVIPLRKENDHKSELTSQLLYGDSFKIIDQRKDWYKIRLDWDKYEGWITQNQAIIIEEKEHKLLQEQPFSASKHLIDFVHLANEQIFPIPLGSDLRALSLLGHSIEYTPTILSSKKRSHCSNCLSVFTRTLSMGRENAHGNRLLWPNTNGV